MQNTVLIMQKVIMINFFIMIDLCSPSGEKMKDLSKVLGDFITGIRQTP